MKKIPDEATFVVMLILLIYEQIETNYHFVNAETLKKLLLYEHFYMKNLVRFLPFLFLLLSCSGNDKQEVTEIPTTTFSEKDTTLTFFGDTINPDSAIASDLVNVKLKGKDSVQLKISGKIMEVCQKKGCWMELDIGKEKTMRVTFKDYAFFVPKDAAGKTAILEGYAYNDTTSVEMLRHYAEDAGKSKKEIEAITQPEVSTSFEARGVIIKK